MPIKYRGKSAVLSGLVTVEETEALLEWLQKWPAARIDLAACSHLHPANLQVLMVAKPVVIAWPVDAEFARWLKSALAARG
jgi:Zn-dependent protease with chaperone function